MSGRAAALAAALVVLALPGCGGGGGRSEITVFAASSLTESFTEMARQFEAEHPAVRVTLNFAASSRLVAQLDAGAPADVLATADEEPMANAVDVGTVRAPEPFARNRLAIVVAPGNPKGIRTVADLGRSGVAFVLCAPEVPCGRLGTAVLERAGVTAVPESEEANVKAAVTRVTTGEVDASLVYVTDVRAAGARAEGVDVPGELNPVATYPIAVTSGADDPATARSFVDFVRSPAGQRILRAAGFEQST